MSVGLDEEKEVYFKASFFLMLAKRHSCPPLRRCGADKSALLDKDFEGHDHESEYGAERSGCRRADIPIAFSSR